VNLVDAGVMVTTWDVFDTYAISGTAVKELKSDESLIKLGKGAALPGIDQKDSEESVHASTITGQSFNSAISFKSL